MNGGTVGVAILASSLATMTFADAPATPPLGGNLDSDIAMILDNTLPETAYGAKPRCLTRGAYRSVEVIDQGHLLFWGSGGRVWLNQLRPPCVGLAKDQILKFRMNGPSLCELDQFEGFDRYQPAGIIAICGLQRFEVITQEQAKQLQDMLRRRAHSAAANVPPPQPQSKPQSQPESKPQSQPEALRE